MHHYNIFLQICLAFLILGGCAFGAGLLGMAAGCWLTKEGEEFNKKVTIYGAIVFVISIVVLIILNPCFSCSYGFYSSIR